MHLAKTASEALLPGETIIATIDLLNTAALDSSAPQKDNQISSQPSAISAVAAADTGLLSLTRLARLTASTKALVSLLSEVRVFMRLWGLLGIYQSAKRLYLQQQQHQSQSQSQTQTGPRTKAHDKPLIYIAWAQLACGAAFQILENGAYLAQRGVLNGRSWTATAPGEGAGAGAGTGKQARWWLWSARFWAGCVALEGVRLARVWQLDVEARKKKEKSREMKRVEGAGVDGRDEKKGDEAGVEEAVVDGARWWKDALVNTAYAPMTVHYSLPGGLVGEEYIAMLGMVAGGLSFKSLWEQTKC